MSVCFLREPIKSWPLFMVSSNHQSVGGETAQSEESGGMFLLELACWPEREEVKGEGGGEREVTSQGKYLLC